MPKRKRFGVRDVANTLAEFSTPLGFLAAAVVAFVIILFLLRFLFFYFLAPSASLPDAVSDIFATPEPSFVPAPDSLLVSFTDLFSTDVIRNASASNAYEDLKLTTLSFPPVFDWQRQDAPSSRFSDTVPVAAWSSENELAVLTRSGGAELVSKSGGQSVHFDLVNDVPLAAALDYDDEGKLWVAAFVTVDGVEIRSFSAGGGVARALSGRLSATTIKEFSPASPLFSIACRSKKCFAALEPFPDVLAASRIEPHLFEFDLSRVSEARSVPLPGVPFTSISVGKTSDDFLIGTVGEKSDGKYAGRWYFWNGGTLRNVSPQKVAFVSNTPGTIRFGYAPEPDQVLAVYGSYEAFAARYSFNAERSMVQVADVSRFFPPRVMMGRESGTTGFIPQVVWKNAAWFVGSAPGSPGPKLLRISQDKVDRFDIGLAADLTDRVAPGAESLYLAPGWNEHEVFAVAKNGKGGEVYLMRDNGFEYKERMIYESKRLNVWDGAIVSAKLGFSDASKNNDPKKGLVYFLLSDDGGKTWAEAKEGERMELWSGKPQKDAPSGDVRFRAELYPALDKWLSPWVDTVRVDYEIIRN